MSTAIVANLVFLRRGMRIVLAPKKRTLGVGVLSGYGGKVEEGETVVEALIREVKEESGVLLKAHGLVQYAIIRTYRGMTPLFELHVFIADEWHGEPQETEEHGKPAWFSVDALPYHEMFPDDCHWLPRVLAEEFFEADVYLSADGTLTDRVVFWERSFA